MTILDELFMTRWHLTAGDRRVLYFWRAMLERTRPAYPAPADAPTADAEHQEHGEQENGT